MKMSAFSSKTQKNAWKYRIQDTTSSFENMIQLLDVVSDIECKIVYKKPTNLAIMMVCGLFLCFVALFCIN